MAYKWKPSKAAAAEKARGAGFPDLTGSPKQITWATKIRQDFMDRYFPWIQLTDRGREFLMRFMEERTDSKFWIDYRDSFNNLYLKIGKLYESLYPVPETENTAEAVPSAENIYE